MKNTRKHRNKRKLKSKGGGTSRKLEPGPSIANTLKTMFHYGITAILVGPLYLIAEALNIPMTSLNSLSRNAFADMKQFPFLHVPIHKMITGCPIKTMDPNNFVLQDDMYIDNNVAVVSCDDKGANTSEVPSYGRTYSDSFRDFFGILEDKRKLRHHVFGLFQYIENIRETDEGRKVHIQKLIQKISDYSVLLRCYVIYRSIEKKCPSIKNNKKTVLKDEDVVKIVNPYFIPGPASYTKKIGCVYKHVTKKRFDYQDMADCQAKCETCTFRNSISRLSAQYASIFSTGGCRVTMAKRMINTYFTDLVKVRDTGIALPSDEKGVVAYLDKLKIETNIKGDTADEEMVLDKFNRFICKYDIIPVLKKQIEKIIKERLEAGYPMKTLMHSAQNAPSTASSISYIKSAFTSLIPKKETKETNPETK